MLFLWNESRDLSLGTAPHVERLDHSPSPLRFLRDFVSPSKPCVISGGALHWPAISRWSTDSYLSHAMSGHAVSVHLTPDGKADSVIPLGDDLCFASAFVEKMDFDEALACIISSGDPYSPFVAYAQEQNDCLRSEYSSLSDDVEPDIPWATEALGCEPEAVNLWIGNGRSETSFHKDHYENLYAVVSGEKHFLLLPPTEQHRLYVRHFPSAQYTRFNSQTGELKLEMEQPERLVPWCTVDPTNPLLSFPLYSKGPKPFHCTVKAGDILYLPSMWFHHVKQTPDCSGRVIAVNYWYDMRFDIKYAYFNFLQSISITNCDKDDDDELSLPAEEEECTT